MPIYEYSCSRCGREFERYVSAAGTAVACPHCGNAKVMRRLSVVSVKTGGSVTSSAGSMGGGGCCGGGGCACH